jgi:hypothetical protein
MTKSNWESRVGMLLDPTKHGEFVYSYKPVDGPHGGQPKIDWFACDVMGRFWLIEVKWLPESRRSINLMKEVTAGQRQGLSAVGLSEAGIALLAIGQGKTLRIYSYREVMLWMTDHYTMQDPSNPSLLLPVDDTTCMPLLLQWSGPKSWNHSLFDLYDMLDPRRPLVPSLTLLEDLSREQVPSVLTWKPKGSTPIVPLMRPLEP